MLPVNDRRRLGWGDSQCLVTAAGGPCSGPMVTVSSAAEATPRATNVKRVSDRCKKSYHVHEARLINWWARKGVCLWLQARPECEHSQVYECKTNTTNRIVWERLPMQGKIWKHARDVHYVVDACMRTCVCVYVGVRECVCVGVCGWVQVCVGVWECVCYSVLVCWDFSSTSSSQVTYREGEHTKVIVRRAGF